jgi:DNA-binding MarR family transcriptional regulator
MPSRPAATEQRTSQDHRPAPKPSTGTLLLHAYQAFERRLFERFQDRGQVGLRPKHGAVIANLDADGTRPSVLAARAGMTRPAMGELIDELEEKGYVTRIPDPGDRRSKLIMPTSLALVRQEVAGEIMAELEAAYRTLLGRAAYQELRRSLTTLVAMTGSGYEVAQPRPRPAGTSRGKDRRSADGKGGRSARGTAVGKEAGLAATGAPREPVGRRGADRR